MLRVQSERHKEAAVRPVCLWYITSSSEGRQAAVEQPLVVQRARHRLGVSCCLEVTLPRSLLLDRVRAEVGESAQLGSLQLSPGSAPCQDVDREVEAAVDRQQQVRCL